LILRPGASDLVIAHDYLTQPGGAERVVLAMARAFPSAPILTAVYDPDRTFSEFADCRVHTTGLQRSRLIVGHHRLGLPLYAAVFGRVIVDAPLVVCSTAGWAHGVRATGLKALYVHNTARWLYQRDEYLDGRLSRARPLIFAMSGGLRRWDRKASATADKVWVTSRVVQERVRRHWTLDSEILPPPHGIDPYAPQEPVPDLAPGFFLSVARLLRWKRLDAVVDAMRSLPDHRLMVVGDGPERRELESNAPPNCMFLCRVSQPQLRWLYANCIGLLSASHEDFGLTPLEAMAFGKPVAVLRRGGFLETVREGETGIFFDEQDPRAVRDAALLLADTRWDHGAIAAWADRFSEAAFAERFRAEVEALLT
jgi:glycosyltransferase involved in cell wall biosynthesis